MRFNGILGHERALAVISAYMQNNRLLGSYIFSGPEAIGKKMIARIIAQGLNCQDPQERPCGQCASCLKIQKDQHPDVHIIQGEDPQIKIEDIREILRQASFRPYEGCVKVFIIDEAHRLNQEAANSLLKVLEEPPKDALFILITHKPQNIIKTILSRCKSVRFAPLVRGQLEDILIKRYALDRVSAHFLAYYAEGRLGEALKLKDTPLSADKNKVFEAFLLARKPLDRSIMGQGKQELQVSLNILASWLRDIYLLKCGLGEKEAIHMDRYSDLQKIASRYSFKQLDEIISAISESSMYLEKNINSKLLLHNLGAQLWKD